MVQEIEMKNLTMVTTLRLALKKGAFTHRFNTKTGEACSVLLRNLNLKMINQKIEKGLACFEKQI